MSARGKNKGAAAAAAPPPPSPSPAAKAPVRWTAPSYRPAGRPVAAPLGAPPVVPMVTPVTAPPAEAASPAAAAAPAPGPPPAAPFAPPASSELEPAAARPRQWAPPAPEVKWAPPEGMGNAAHASNSYDERLREREYREWLKSKQVPQGDSQLVHLWVHALTQVPAAAATIWLTRTEPSPSYDVMIDGASLVTSDFPDRKLYDVAASKRRQPTVLERFTGRIRARLPDGTYVELGCGEISFPPEPAQATQTPWIGAAPVWPGYPGAPYGMPPYGAPPGYPPPYGAAPGYPPTYGMPPYGYGWPGAYGAQPAAQQSQVLEKIVADLVHSGKGSPETLVSLLKVMQEGSHKDQGALQEMNNTLLKIALERRDEKGGDEIEKLTKWAALIKELKGDSGESNAGASGFHIHKYDGNTLVEQDGKLDVAASLAMSGAPLLRDAIKQRVAAAAVPRSTARPINTAAGGPGPAKIAPPGPSPSGLNGTNGSHN